jgi:hypothetical protein
MEERLSANLFVRELARRQRVMLLGGLAVIAHGLERKTKDVDIWLEPLADASTWADVIKRVLNELNTGRFWSLQRNNLLLAEEVAADVAATGVVRVTGFDRDIDVFRKPNELSITDFDRVWSLSTGFDDGVRLPHEADILVTKLNTGRDRDEADMQFLEARVRRRFIERLPVCDLEEARSLLNRYMDPRVLEAALKNPNGEVRDHAMALLEQLEADGDPYSREILQRLRNS